MMEKITGNEPITATPSLRQGGAQSRENEFDYIESGSKGLSIRQHFAGLIMQGMYSNHEIVNQWNCESIVAENAVKAADALIAELNK